MSEECREDTREQACDRGDCAQEPLDFRKESAEIEVFNLTKPVFFVGFMGAGKTSTARKLARLAGVAAVDMDTYLERREQKKVKQIFAEVGEEGFRKIETDVLYELAASEPKLISCGGGVILKEENRAELARAGFVIYLKVTAHEAASRIHDLSTRPLFGDLDHAEQVAQSRLAFYEEVADYTIDTAGRGSASIAREAFSILKKEGVLWQQK